MRDAKGLTNDNDRTDKHQTGVTYSLTTREDEGKEQIPHTWASSDENYLKTIFGSVSDCVVILRTTPHWTARVTSCNFRLLTWEQQIKITFAACVRTNNKFLIIIIGHWDSQISYFIVSCWQSIGRSFPVIGSMRYLRYLWLMYYPVSDFNDWFVDHSDHLCLSYWRGFHWSIVRYLLSLFSSLICVGFYDERQVKAFVMNSVIRTET